MKIDKTIIDRVLDNRATPEEAKTVLDWFDSEEGSAYLSERLADESASLTPQRAEEWLDHPVPTARMRQRFINSVHQKKRFRINWRWAAVIIPFLILSGTMMFIADRAGLLSPTQYAELYVPCGEQMQVVLQDGTIVQLNSDTRLRYPKTFGLFKRKVELSGEGYFKVAKESNRPFVVDLKGVDVRVTGTQFNVKAYPSETMLQVALDEGGVRLEDEYHRTYVLSPGEYADYDRQSGKCRIVKPKELASVTAWRTHSLNFYRVPLQEILKTLQRQYDVSFDVKEPQLLSVKFTISTSKTQIRDILQELEKVSSVRFVQQGDNAFTVNSGK